MSRIMPLETGKSREVFEHNVKEEIAAGSADVVEMLGFDPKELSAAK
jgi:hypothetical protein